MGADDLFDDILNWFHGLVDWIPWAGDFVADMLIGPIPQAKQEAVYALADQWAALAEELTASYSDISTMANPILESWSGDGAAQTFVEEWFTYLEGLSSTAESAGEMQQLVQNFGLEVELMKYMAALNLFMLAASVYAMIAASPLTFGGSLGAAPAAFAATKALIKEAADKTVREIMALVLRVALKSMVKLFSKAAITAGRDAAIGAGRKLATTLAKDLSERIAEITASNGAKDLARNIVGRGIAKGTADRLAADALKGLAGKELRTQLGDQTVRTVQKELAKEIEEQLLKKWANTAVREEAENAVLRELAEQQVEKAVLGKELAKYVATRAAYGAVFMGGGNLVIQGGQVLAGHRDGIDFQQVGGDVLQGAVFGAGMFGGVPGHVAGGALAGGGLTLGQQLLGDGKVNWSEVGRSAVQGGEGGVLFGTQSKIEHFGSGLGGLKIGDEVHVLPGSEHGDFTIAAAKGDEGVVLTSDGQIATQSAADGRDIPEALQGRDDVLGAIDEHWSSGDAPTVTQDAPAPRLEAPAGKIDLSGSRTDPGTSASASDRGGGGGGGGSRQSARGDSTATGSGDRSAGPRGDHETAAEPGPAAAGDRASSGTEAPSDRESSAPHDTASAPRDGGPPDGGDPPRDGTAAPPQGTEARPEAGPRAGHEGSPERVAAEPDRSAAGNDRVAPEGDRTALRRDDVPADRAPGDQSADGSARAEDNAGGNGNDRAVTDRGAAERGAEHRPDERRDDVASPLRPTDSPARADTAPRGAETTARHTGSGPEHRTPEGTERPEQGDRDHVPLPDRDADGPPGGPHDSDPARPDAAHEDHVPVMRSAGAEPGLPKSPEADRQGTVRMELHPDYPDTVAYLDEHGFKLVPDEKTGPRTVLRHVYTLDGKTFLREEREVRFREGMRYLDLEHELDHVHQLVDVFDGKLATEAARERPNGDYAKAKAASGVLSDRRDTVVEYHVRLTEAIRLIDRGVDRSIIDTHLAGVEERRQAMNFRIDKYATDDIAWRNEHFPDLSRMERQLGEKVAEIGAQRPAHSPSFRDGGQRMAKDSGGSAPEAGAHGVEPRRMVDVGGTAPEHPVLERGEVSDLAGREIAGLIEGRSPGAPDQPHRADWDPGSGTLRVHYGDGTEVDVQVMVNDSVPPGHAIVVRPELEAVGDGWRQDGPARIGLSPHVPGDVAARAPHVHEALSEAWRTLHREVGDQLRPHDAGHDPHPPARDHQVPEHDAQTGAAIRPRDEVRAYEWADRAYERFRGDDSDIADITRHLAATPRPDGRLGYSEAEIRQVKEHLTLDEHPIRDYDGDLEMRRFDASPDIAEAWIRLGQGRPLPEDLVLLNHELAESTLMRANPEMDYRTAHDFANEQHNWQDNVPGRTGEDLDGRYGRQSGDGDPDRLPEDPRGRDTGGVPVRSSGDGPGAGHREGDFGGHAGGRDGGPGVRGGAHEDPADPARAGDLAGGRDVRGLEPESLRELEDPAGAGPLERGAEAVGRHEAAAAEPPQPERLTPDGVRQALSGRSGPDHLGRWAEDHLVNSAEDGTQRPKSAEEIDATVRGLADEALDLVSPVHEPGPPDGLRHNDSPIEGTEHVPAGRPLDQADLSPQELLDASERVLPQDFAGDLVQTLAVDGPYVRVGIADGVVEHFLPRVGSGMHDLAETVVRAGTREDPHIVTVNDRVAGDQLGRVWAHEITETMAEKSAAQIGPERKGVVRRAMSAIGKIFGGGRAHEPERPAVEPHTAARINERLFLKRQQEWAYARPEEAERLQREINGLDADLAELGYRPPRGLFDDLPRAASGFDGVLGRPAETPRNELPPSHEPPVHEHSAHGAAAQEHSHISERAPGEPEHVALRQPGEARTPLRDLIPAGTEHDLDPATIEREFTREISGRDYAGFDVRVKQVEVNSRGMSVDLVVVRPGESRELGQITREFEIDPQTGDVVVHHERLRLEDSIQGSGFAKAFNDHLEGWYTESGVSHIRLHAASSVGAYAWARAGYDWGQVGDHEARTLLDRLRGERSSLHADIDDLGRAHGAGDQRAVNEILAKHGLADRSVTEAANQLRAQDRAATELIRRSGQHDYRMPGYPSPYDISQVGRSGEHGAGGTWIGKRAMLGGAFHGTKAPEARPEAPLDPDHQLDPDYRPPAPDHADHWMDRLWEQENRAPTFDELIPRTDTEATRWGDQILGEFARYLERPDFDGLQLDITSARDQPLIEAHRDSVVIRPEIRDASGRVGQVTWTIRRETDGGITAVRGAIELPEHLREHGFPEAWDNYMDGWTQYSGAGYAEDAAAVGYAPHEFDSLDHHLGPHPDDPGAADRRQTIDDDRPANEEPANDPTGTLHLLAFDDSSGQGGALRMLTEALGAGGDEVALRVPGIEAGELSPGVRAIAADPIPGVTGPLSPLLRPDGLPGDTRYLVGYGDTAGIAEVRRDAYPDALVVQLVDTAPTGPAHLEVLSRADLIVAVGPEVAAALRSGLEGFGSERVPPVHEMTPPIDPGPQPVRPADTGRYHVLVSTDDRAARFEAIAAVRELREQGADVRVTVAFRELDDLTLDWQDRVLGRASGGAVDIVRLPEDRAGTAGLLRDVDVVVDPSDGARIDPAVTAAAEHGVPVLVRENSGAGRLLEDVHRADGADLGGGSILGRHQDGGLAARLHDSASRLPQERERALELRDHLAARHTPEAAARGVRNALARTGEPREPVPDEVWRSQLDPRAVVERLNRDEPPLPEGSEVVMTVCTEYNSTRGGVITANQELSRGLAQAGAHVYGRVSAVDPTRPEATRDETPEGVHVRGVSEVWGVVDAKGHPDARALSMLFENLPARVDVLIGHSRFGGGVAKVLHEHVYPDAKRVHVLHTSPEVLDAVRGNPAEGLGHAATEMELIRGADLAVGIGPLLGEDVARLADLAKGDGPATPAHTVISDMPRHRLDPPPRPPDREHIQLYVQGRAGDLIKGVDFAARLVGDLRAEGHDVRLVVRGAEANKVADMQLRLTELAGVPVEVRPFVASHTPEGAAELLHDLHESDVVLMPSIQEGFGLVAGEAARAGVPVIVGEGTGAGKFFGNPHYVPEELGRPATVRDGNTVGALLERVRAEVGDVAAFPDKIRDGILTGVDQDRATAWKAHIREALGDLEGNRARALELRDHLDRTYPLGRAAERVLDVLRGNASPDRAVAFEDRARPENQANRAVGEQAAVDRRIAGETSSRHGPPDPSRHQAISSDGGAHGQTAASTAEAAERDAQKSARTMKDFHDGLEARGLTDHPMFADLDTQTVGKVAAALKELPQLMPEALRSRFTDWSLAQAAGNPREFANHFEYARARWLRLGDQRLSEFGNMGDARRSVSVFLDSDSGIDHLTKSLQSDVAVILTDGRSGRLPAGLAYDQVPEAVRNLSRPAWESPAAEAYHASKHQPELPESERDMQNPVEAYLRALQITLRTGHLVPDGATAAGGTSRRLEFVRLVSEKKVLSAIVYVKPDGAVIATHMRRKMKPNDFS